MLPSVTKSIEEKSLHYSINNTDYLEIWTDEQLLYHIYTNLKFNGSLAKHMFKHRFDIYHVQ